MKIFNTQTLSLIGAVVILLGLAEAVLAMLKRRPDSGLDAAALETFRRRVRAWWILFSALAGAFLMGHWATVILFGLMGFWALREFITVTPTRPSDHITLFWVFFIFTPLQFILVGIGYFGLYSIVIPVYAFLFIPARIALVGDYRRFLERTAKIQAGLLICVYCLSHAPALLSLPLNSPEAATPITLEAAANEATIAVSEPLASTANKTPLKNISLDAGGNIRLLFFFILLVQLSDALQYAWSQLPSKHVIVPSINTTHTWEGLLGGTASTTLIGAALWWATPFQGAHWWMAAAMAALIAVMGFAGKITMSAIKRERGVRDYGTLVEGHSGVLDRIDSICFAAPVFFHCTRWWLVLNHYIPPVG